MSLNDEIAGITCSQVIDVLSDHVDGELADEVRARVEAHVAACSNCERFGGVFAEVIRGLRASIQGGDDRPAFERLRRRLESL